MIIHVKFKFNQINSLWEKLFIHLPTHRSYIKTTLCPVVVAILKSGWHKKNIHFVKNQPMCIQVKFAVKLFSGLI